MEEAELLKERLQAITDKRRIQEDIAKKRRQIEEEKLKLQYIKKKALRDQWLMDGVSQQSEEEQEASRIQAQEEQQQSDELQSNIHRIEKEIEALETQELNISANEEVVLKRLKEVERTAEDIIKKASSVDKEADGKKLKESCSTTEKHNSISVAMETDEESKLVMDCEVEVAEDDSPGPGRDFCANDEPVCIEADSSDSLGTNKHQGALLTNTPTGPDETGKPGCTENTACTQGPFQGQSEALVLQPGHEELNRNESINSSVSDTLSSADSVYENEAHCKRQVTSGQDPDPQEVPEPKQFPDPQDAEHQKYPELEEDLVMRHCSLFEQDPKLEQDSNQEQELEQYPEPEQFHEPELDPDLELYPLPEPDSELESFPLPEFDPELELYPLPEPDLELERYPMPEFEDGDNNHNPEDDSDQNLAIFTDNDPETKGVPFEPPVVEESILEQCIREEAMSDVSNESDHDPDCEEIVECLRAEIAATSSDSDTDEKWRSIFSSSINKEDDDSYLDSLELSAQELFVQKVEVVNFEEPDKKDFEEVRFEVPQVEEIQEQPEDISLPVPSQDIRYNLLGLQGLSKISEDDSENARDASHSLANHQHHMNADTTKKLPKDFCVIQETKSENVSTEHVDFQLARKQWREIEEQTKNKISLPTTKQHSFHGSHSFMYTPVRNIERTTKKAHDLESLNLVGEYPHTQFSPCSEDSGLDDSSYRSPYDDTETTVEREIRASMEREENFKRERGLSRMGKSTDCAPSRNMPRSISTPLTPSFIITSSPTKKPQDMSANNVIILDPSSDFSTSPRQGKDNMTVRSTEWRSEDNGSNLIILETSNLIIRSASEFSLSKACEQPQEKMFLNNPFFKLRSRSTISLVDEEIKMVKQREEELQKERANLYGKNRFDTEREVSNRMDTLSFGHSVDVPMKCKSSPSSPMKTPHRMDRSALSCDHRFPEVYTGGRRKSAMALRWEAGEFTKTD